MAKLIGSGRARLRHRVFAHLESIVPSPAYPGTSQAGVGRWRWLLADAAGVAVPGPAVCFTSGVAAENWLAAGSGRLRELGVSAVTLFDGEHAVYGPAPLSRQE